MLRSRYGQPQLASRGLSSLGRTESHVRQRLETVLHVLHVLDGKKDDRDFSSTAMTGVARILAPVAGITNADPSRQIQFSFRIIF